MKKFFRLFAISILVTSCLINTATASTISPEESYALRFEGATLILGGRVVLADHQDSAPLYFTSTFFIGNYWMGAGHNLTDAVNLRELYLLENIPKPAEKLLSHSEKSVEKADFENLQHFSKTNLTHIGDVRLNSEVGVLGALIETANLQDFLGVKVAKEIPPGPTKGYLYTNFFGDEPKIYEIEIYYDKTMPKGKQVSFNVVDPDFFSECTGLIGGMSGTPIITKDLEIIGALWAMSKSDLFKGYVRPIDDMLEELAKYAFQDQPKR